MTPTTTSIFDPNFGSELVLWLLKIYGDATAKAYGMIWEAAWHVVMAHIFIVLTFLVLLLLASAIQAFTTGRWGWFGSVLYHYFFGGALIIIGAIWGPEVFASDYMDIFLFVLYILCFSLVGLILTKTGLRHRH